MAHVLSHLVDIDQTIVSCVDGRQHIQTARGIKRPGADMGVVGGLLYLDDNLDGVVAMDAVSHGCRKIGRWCYAHTDNHDKTGKSEDCGCGHLKNMILTYDYGINPEEMRRAYAVSKQEPLVKWLVLEGHHEEEGVILNKGATKTVINANPNRERMFYVYDAIASFNDLANLVDAIRNADMRRFQNITAEKVQEAIDIQLGVTLQKLSGKHGMIAADMPQLTINPNALFGLMRGY